MTIDILFVLCMGLLKFIQLFLKFCSTFTAFQDGTDQPTHQYPYNKADDCQQNRTHTTRLPQILNAEPSIPVELLCFPEAWLSEVNVIFS